MKRSSGSDRAGDLSRACVRVGGQHAGSVLRLARLSGVSRGSLYRVANGKRELSFAALVRLAKALRMPAWRLLRLGEEYAANEAKMRNDMSDHPRVEREESEAAECEAAE